MSAGAVSEINYFYNDIEAPRFISSGAPLNYHSETKSGTNVRI
jgi:hypothetical protein